MQTRGALIIGGNRSQIATLIERKTRYVMHVTVKRIDTETVIAGIHGIARLNILEMGRTVESRPELAPADEESAGSLWVLASSEKPRKTPRRTPIQLRQCNWPFQF